MIRKVLAYTQKLAWYLGGQKRTAEGVIDTPPLGYIARDATFVGPENIFLGEGCQILPGARLICSRMPPYLTSAGSISLNEGSIIREGAILQTYGGIISIGRNCTVNAYCILQGNGNITVGDNVLIAAHVCIFSANHVFEDPDRLIRSQGEKKLGVTIEDDVWLGAGVKVLDGVTIGKGAVVAAGAVVSRDIVAYSVMGGVPARMIKMRKGP
jgi:acetyltransferase-like isoleucine patch superfamily enzyme